MNGLNGGANMRTDLIEITICICPGIALVPNEIILRRKIRRVKRLVAVYF